MWLKNSSLFCLNFQSTKNMLHYNWTQVLNIEWHYCRQVQTKKVSELKVKVTCRVWNSPLSFFEGKLWSRQSNDGWMDGWQYFTVQYCWWVFLWNPKSTLMFLKTKPTPLATVIPYSSILLQLMKHEKKPKVLPHPPNSLNASMTQHPWDAP